MVMVINPRVVRGLGFVALGLVFSTALFLLYRELRHVDVDDVMQHLRETPTPALLAAVGLTVLSYLTLTIYDFLGLRYAKKPLPFSKTAFASFIAYVFSNNIGLSIFGSLAFRYRIYSSFDLTAEDVTKVSLFCAVTFWLGLLTLGGVVFIAEPPPPLPLINLSPEIYRGLGGLFLILGCLYFVACTRGGRDIRLGRWLFSLPSGRVAAQQVVVASLDWALSSSILYVLMPPSVHVSWLAFLSIFTLSSVASAVLHVPAGLGIIETIMLAAFASAAPASALLSSLIVYRAVYYLMPLVVAVVWMIFFEVSKATGMGRSATANAKRWFEAIIPRVYSVLVFTSGVILLLSGALPAIEERRLWLEHSLPLAFIEASHVFASITGAALLVVARGLQKRLDGAYVLTCVLLAAGALFSLLKGVDYEEAFILAVALMLLAPCRAYFYRKASLLDANLSLAWVLAIALSLLSMLWLVWFGNKHVEYQNELWWSFTFAGDAPRSLRAALAACAVAFLLGLGYLLRPSKAAPQLPPKASELEPIIAASEHTYPNLALAGDKSVLFNPGKTAFIMYATEGRSWVAMGDPVGPLGERQDLIWQYRDLVDRYGGWPVFYQVDADNLHLYVEAGLSLLKIGEEAFIDLPRFSLSGRDFKALRNVMNRLSAEGWQLEVTPAADVPALMPELSRVSDGWLAARNLREKKFSLGRFSPDYLNHFPMALIRRDGVIAAFANLWVTSGKQELSVDLMRYDEAAPAGVMDFLMVSILQWGQSQGFGSFNLGIAPFSGMESRPLAPLWSRLGAKLFEHGERLYNFQGLREYKEKFGPEWRPKYLASHPGRALPYILANVATLISGGIKGAISR